MQESDVYKKHNQIMTNNFDKMLTQLELSQKRYIEAEKMIVHIMKLPWYKRIFISKRLIQFLETRPVFEYIDFKSNQHNKKTLDVLKKLKLNYKSNAPSREHED